MRETLSGNVTMNTEGRGSNISGAIENATEKLSKKNILWAKPDYCFRNEYGGKLYR